MAAPTPGTCAPQMGAGARNGPRVRRGRARRGQVNGEKKPANTPQGGSEGPPSREGLAGVGTRASFVPRMDEAVPSRVQGKGKRELKKKKKTKKAR